MVNNYRKKIRREIDELPKSGIELVLHVSKYYPNLSLGIGEPNFNTPPHIVQAAIQALEQGKTHYTSDEGLNELREAIAEKTRNENGFYPDPETEIVVTAGTSPALYGVVQTILNFGDEVIIPTPAYFSYDSIVRIFGGRPVHVPGVEDSYFIPDQNDLAEAISPKTKLIIVCTPNNPTGGVWEKQQLKAALDLAEDHDLLILADELYEKLVYDGVRNFSVASLPNAHERTITINGLSKSHAMTGFRIGWIIAPPSILTGFSRIHEHSTICASAISQDAALAALRGSQEPVVEMVNEYDRRRKMMVERINNDIPMMRAKAPRGGFFVFTNVKELIGSRLEEMKRSLKDEGRNLLESMPSRLFSSKDLDTSGSLVSMLYLAHFARIMGVCGSFFGPGGEGYLRLSFAQDYNQIETALERMAETLNKLA